MPLTPWFAVLVCARRIKVASSRKRGNQLTIFFFCFATRILMDMETM